eukprot:6201344-Pleurochrysis_carterae.AAC.2
MKLKTHRGNNNDEGVVFQNSPTISYGSAPSPYAAAFARCLFQVGAKTSRKSSPQAKLGHSNIRSPQPPFGHASLSFTSIKLSLAQNRIAELYVAANSAKNVAQRHARPKLGPTTQCCSFEQGEAAFRKVNEDSRGVAASLAN